MTDLDQRRIALADELAVMLRAAGMSGRQLAQAARWQPSKVSRILTGKQGITDADIVTWCDLTGTAAVEADRLRGVLRSIRADEARWSRQAAAGHRAVQEDMASLEQRASSIRQFDLVLVPGLLQTAEYAAAVFRSLADVRNTPHDTDQAVHVRMLRQSVLYDSTKTIELLTSEFALRHPIGDRAVMAAQLDRLIALDGLRSVRLGIVPMNTVLPVPALHGFCVLDDDQVLVETLHNDASTGDPTDVALYGRIADALWSVAATGAEARHIIQRAAQDLRALS
ncbi:MAG: helix-turn-helix domain-containing protein [Actinophytocola sp.]|uniref:helix-turn-helix domain-containing protein n=1 Tax=Actinophytocola sp. TaxID=1872138 RepID=UPI001322FFFA|nr:helix-turn-helix transcriptional regulator [Actinophytocola sp.]MPZ79620.1 helix-turn-helix domain-containing protein [Actinophytocola sp.]